MRSLIRDSINHEASRNFIHCFISFHEMYIVLFFSCQPCPQSQNSTDNADIFDEHESEMELDVAMFAENENNVESDEELTMISWKLNP